jgi:hypothetical protein
VSAGSDSGSGCSMVPESESEILHSSTTSLVDVSNAVNRWVCNRF